MRQLSERLASVQHELGEAVRATMHAHLESLARRLPTRPAKKRVRARK